LFGGRIVHELIERTVIQLGENLLLDRLREQIEVHDHPGRGPGGLERPLERDLQTVRMAVQSGALPGVVRQHVRRLECERFANLHPEGFAAGRRGASPHAKASVVESSASPSPADAIAAHERAEPVILVAYDPQWPHTFEAIRAAVAAALGELAIGIEHIGSTAVPGLPAKPIVDVDVVVRRASDLPDVTARLAAIGYRYLGNLGIIGRDAFRAPAGAPEQHLFVCPSSSAELRAHLGFRDALRRSPELAAEYAALKAELARTHRYNRDAYAEGKSRFIAAALLGAHEGPRRSRRH
jgi:GrpB-like predicted nucleotidyltransferase (UPF0157 family)